MCKQIRSKVPILLNFVIPKRPSGNYYVTFLCTENPGLEISNKHIKLQKSNFDLVCLDIHEWMADCIIFLLTLAMIIIYYHLVMKM